MGNPEERWYVPQPYDSRQRRGLEAWLFGLWEKSMELLARRVMQRIYSAHFGSSRYPSFEHIRQRVALALNNHHSLSEGPIAPLLPSMLDIGGILLEQLPALELSAHPKRPFILFSLGTRYSWRSASGAALQQIFVHVFAQFPNYDIYWTYDGNNGSAISAAYTHIKLAKWWPQAQLLSLPHARLFITHGGKGSLTEALYFGHTPVLGLPFNGEQRANLGKAQAKGWALMFDKRQLTTDQLLCGMQRVLSERSFKQHIQTAARIYKDRPLNASQLTVYWLEYILRYKGALQLSGTARELPLYEFYLLDVRLFIYSMLIILIFMLFWLDKRSE
ncbi:CG11289 [Drosophila busckii]|uniref:UDP-glucuronosyltransferase n=1 Tax=Drosophila busckii TaxID=30019 RepID=A0A0M4EEK0_DROBS|nr:CG11289 [Drosophila busckii]